MLDNASVVNFDTQPKMGGIKILNCNVHAPFLLFSFNFNRVGNTGKNAIKRNAIFHITKSLDFGQRPSIYLIHWFALSSYLSTHIVVVLTWLMQYSTDLIRLLVKWGIGSWTTRFSEYKTFSQSRQSSKCDIKMGEIGFNARGFTY